jgi:hypothetical protein
MKTSVVMIVLFLLSWTGMAQNERYLGAMGNGLGQLSTAMQQQKAENFQQTMNFFERIALAETQEWLPNYYASLSGIMGSMSANDITDKDALLDKAEVFLKKAQAIAADNDEVAVLEAQLAQARLSVDPMNRWAKYGPQQQKALAKAEKINAQNPRIYMLRGLTLYYTPEQFGGGAKVACPVLQTSMEKYTAFKPISAIHPTWGQDLVKEMVAKCQ